MQIQYFDNTDIKFLNEQLLKFEEDSTVKGILLLACDKNEYTPAVIDPVLKSFKKPIFGGIFPAIIHTNQKYETGFIITTFKDSLVINTINRISSPDTDFENIILNVSESYLNTKTMFIFIDGFAERIGSFIESIFTIFGLEFNYIGGGAGSLSLKQKPCIITNQGLKQDCAIMVGIEKVSGIGVKHGWVPIAGPFKITDSQKTILKELDYKPAFDVYKEVVEAHSQKPIQTDNFFESAKAYPFGINKVDAENVVRDPLSIGDNNSLICVGELQTGSFVNILTGDKNLLVKAAGEAMKTALESRQDPPEEMIFFVDCISRVLFLEEDFTEELEEVISNYKKVPLIGALTIGEIANNGKDYLEFYNKTSVIACF